MKNSSAISSILLCGFLLAGCSKSDGPSPTAKAHASAPAVTAFSDITSFKNKAPEELKKDDAIGKVLRNIVPQAQFQCLDEAFNYMPDLSLASDGSIQSSLSGSHADNWMEAFISVFPGGEVNVVLQCEPGKDSGKEYLFFTNNSIDAPTPKPILDWFYSLPSGNSIVRKSDGRTSRQMSASSFLENQLAEAAKPLSAQNASVDSSMPSSRTSTVGTAQFVGDWSCQSRKSDGATYSSTFRFTSDGEFIYADPQSRMSGAYQLNGSGANVSIGQVEVNGQRSPSSMKVEVTFLSSNPERLAFDMKLVRLGTVISNNCVSRSVAEATPAPAVNICDANPAACESIQRNSDIRSQMRNERCAMLESQLSGMVGGDYQLQKAGCR